MSFGEGISMMLTVIKEHDENIIDCLIYTENFFKMYFLL